MQLPRFKRRGICRKHGAHLRPLPNIARLVAFNTATAFTNVVPMVLQDWPVFMEQSTLIKIARLRTLAARKGRAFDVARFAQDRGFAQATLQALMDTDDEDLLLLGLELMQALGMVGADQTAATAPAPPAPPPKPKPEIDTRYVGRLR